MHLRHEALLPSVWVQHSVRVLNKRKQIQNFSSSSSESERKVQVRFAYILGTGADEFGDVGVSAKHLQLIRELTEEQTQREFECVFGARQVEDGI